MFFDKKDKELRKSEMAAINLATQVMEVATGVRVRFEELKITAGKLRRDSDHEFRTIELDGILAGERLLCSLPLRKEKTLGVWMPTEEGVSIERLCDTLWTAYWLGYDPRQYVSRVAVFEAHKQKSDIRPVWHVGHTALDRVQFKVSELPSLEGIKDYIVSDGREFLEIDPFFERVSFSPYFKSRFRGWIEKNTQYQRLQISRVNEKSNNSFRDVAVALKMGVNMFEINLCQFLAFLWNQEVPSAFTAFIRDTDGIVQKVIARRALGTKDGWHLDAKAFGTGYIGSGFKVVYKKTKPGF